MLKNKTKQKAKTKANTKCSDKRLNAYSPRSNNKTKSPDHITSSQRCSEDYSKCNKEQKGKASRLKRHKTLFADRIVDVEKSMNSTNKQ